MTRAQRVAAGRRPASRGMRLIGTTGEESRTVREAQRARLLACTVQSVAELGYPKLSVADVVARAGASRETFYQIFANREEAFLEALNETVAHIAAVASEASAEQQAWEQQLRVGLETVLGVLEDEPALARVLVESQRAGPRVLRRRTHILDQLAGIVDQGRTRARGGGPPPLTAHSLVAGAVSVVHERLLTPAGGSLAELVGPLMSMIVFPYRGPSAAAAELERPPSPRRRSRSPGKQERNLPLEGMESRLTYLMMRVIGFVAEHPGASNREVGDGVGIVDGGQISKLLARLASLGLIENAAQGGGRGMANSWRIAPRGDQIRHELQL